MEKQLTARQASIIMFILIIANKLLMLPSIISFNSLNDTWLVFLLAFVIDFVVACCIVAVISKSEKTIYQILKQKLGKFFSAAIMSVFAIISALKIADLLFETYIMFNEKIYIDLNPILFFLVMGLVIAYFGTREFRSLGRTIEILFSIICGALVLGYLISIKGADFTYILPVGGTGLSTTLQNTFRHLFWFGDSFVMLFFIGNVKIEKKLSKKMLIWYFIAMLIVLAFVMLFLSIFANTAPMHRNCILDVGEDLPRLITEGRFNWIVDFVMPIAPIFAIGIYSYLAVNIFSLSLGQKIVRKKLVSAIILLIVVFSIIFYFKFLWADFYIFLYSFTPYVCLLFEIAFPIILMISVFVTGKKAVNYEK